MNDADNNLQCPLCLKTDVEKTAFSFKIRHYYFCRNCNLVFADRLTLPDEKDEKKRYKFHQNSEKDDGYLNFLEKAITPMLAQINQDDVGLDYGCGPSKTTSELLARKNILCDVYDPFFFPQIPGKTYDFIISTEVFEHFHQPDVDIKRMVSLIKTGGHLAVMTEFWHDMDKFADWYYIRDYTHVSFYNLETMKHIEKSYSLKMKYTDSIRVVIFQKL